MVPPETTTGALIDAMERQASEERKRIRAEAETRAAATLAEADVEAERLKADALHALEKELAVERQRIVGDSVMRARTERLRVKRRLLAEVFRRAAAEVARRGAGEDERRAALDALGAEARTAVGEPCQLSLDPVSGAVTAASPDGRRRVDNGLPARLARAETYAERDVARILFGGHG